MMEEVSCTVEEEKPQVHLSIAGSKVLVSIDSNLEKFIDVVSQVLEGS